jgi:predicted Rossmann fold flavoprotein
MLSYDVIVVGAGASGLVAAIAAASEGSSVLVIEQKEKAGKKILASGNGKCNYTNMNQYSECYRCDDSTFAKKVLSNFDITSTLQFFEKLGIFPKDRDGYIYPNSEQASSIVSVLLMECERLNIDIVYNEKVTSVSEPEFSISTIKIDRTEKADKAHKTDNIYSKYKGNRLILATGGCASPKLGSDGSGYLLAKSFGHKIVKPLPALVSLKSPDKFCKTISGVRTWTIVTAYGGSKLLCKEEGEIIFTDYGISGIPIMQLSRYVSKSLDAGKSVYLNIDLFVQHTIDELLDILIKRCNNSPNKTIEQMLIGMFNHKLNYILIKEAKLEPDIPCHKLSKSGIMKLASCIKSFTIRINATNTFDFAQVTCGGVSTLEINPNTMESIIKKGLHLTGELIDVDGTCGGYNLQWAWSTGYIAGISANK